MGRIKTRLSTLESNASHHLATGTAGPHDSLDEPTSPDGAGPFEGVPAPWRDTRLECWVGVVQDPTF